MQYDEYLVLYVVTSVGARLMEFNSETSEVVGDVYADMKGDVGIIMGVKAVVKSRLEGMEKEMMAEFVRDEAWRTKIREVLHAIEVNKTDKEVIQGATPTTTTTVTPTTTPRVEVQRISKVTREVMG